MLHLTFLVLVFVSLFFWRYYRVNYFTEFAFYFNICPLHQGKKHLCFQDLKQYYLKKKCWRFSVTLWILRFGCHLTSFLSFHTITQLDWDWYSSVMLWMKCIVSYRCSWLQIRSDSWDKSREVLALCTAARGLIYKRPDTFWGVSKKGSELRKELSSGMANSFTCLTTPKYLIWKCMTSVV